MIKKENDGKQSKFAVVRVIFLAIGFLSIAVGSIGIFLPILPTVPLLLLAAFCLAKGSSRFSNWFVSTRLYKKRLLVFVKYRAMTVSSQLFTLTFICLMFIAICLLSNSIVMAILSPAAACFHAIYFAFGVTAISKTQMKEICKNENI